MSSAWDRTLEQRYGTKLQPKKAATADAGETPEQIETRIRAAEQQRQRDVEAACDIAGQPERASAFIASGQSVSDVLAALAGAVTPKPSERPTPEQRRRARLGD